MTPLCDGSNTILLSTSIYDLVLIYVCHFHHHFLLLLTVNQILYFSSFSLVLSRYSCFYLGSQHPRIFNIKYSSLFRTCGYQVFEVDKNRCHVLFVTIIRGRGITRGKLKDWCKYFQVEIIANYFS